MIYAVIDTNVFISALLSKNKDSATVKVFNAIANEIIIVQKSSTPLTIL